MKGLLCCLVEDTPIVRRAYAGKAAELCAAHSFGGRRANYGASHTLTTKRTWNDAFLSEPAIQSPIVYRDQENCPGSSRRKQRHCKALGGNVPLGALGPAEHNLDDSWPLQLAPISVLEFAQIALDAGGTHSYLFLSGIPNSVLRFKFLAVCSLCFLDLESQLEKNSSRIHLSVKWTLR